MLLIHSVRVAITHLSRRLCERGETFFWGGQTAGVGNWVVVAVVARWRVGWNRADDQWLVYRQEAL